MQDRTILDQKGAGRGPRRPDFPEPRAASLSGVLIVDKPAGMTSLDVVRRVKKRHGTVRMGHAGTLDPLATGVLPVCMGEATKLIDHMDLEWKHYRGGLRLGLETDTLDITGKVVRRECVPDFSREVLLPAFAELEGLQRQQPPAYSAVKFKGKPLYSYARRGQPVEAPFREVRIRAFGLQERRGEFLGFDLLCSRGTYVRSVVQSLGRRLGCGACLVSLRRMRSGRFLIEEAHPLAEVENYLESGKIEDLLLSPEEVLSHLEVLGIQKESEAKALNGNPLAREDFFPVPSAEGFSRREGEKVCLRMRSKVIGVGEVRRGEECCYVQPLRLLDTRWICPEADENESQEE